jgi:DNA-binding CsgD family transcriptional regulator
MKQNTMIDNTKIHAFILALLSAVHGVSPEEFQKKIMDQLQLLIPFDKGLWLSGYVKELLFTHVYLHNLPETLMTSWESMKGQDRVLKGILEESPGKTVDMREFYTRDERMNADIYQKHSRKFGIEHVITTALPDYHTGLVEAISLYRSDRDAPFSKEDRKLKEYLFPLMVEAFCYNQLNYMLSISRQSHAASLAVCDEKAWLRHAEPGFYPLLKTVWPDWSGPVLPKPMMELISSSTRSLLRYEQVSFRHQKSSKLRLIFAHKRTLTRQLTKREDQIAVMFSSGKSHKEIAESLKISPATVRNHLDSVYKKLDVSNKIQLLNVINSA